jgi:hypothetical protein
MGMRLRHDFFDSAIVPNDVMVDSANGTMSPSHKSPALQHLLASSEAIPCAVIQQRLKSYYYGKIIYVHRYYYSCVYIVRTDSSMILFLNTLVPVL